MVEFRVLDLENILTIDTQTALKPVYKYVNLSLGIEMLISEPVKSYVHVAVTTFLSRTSF